MFLGLLLAAMGIGAVAAGAWMIAGGSVLLGLALYSAVATGFVLIAALVIFLVSEHRARPAPPRDTLAPAE